MGRRDEGEQSEHLLLSFDTYLDRRTASTFGVTAAGVRLDRYCCFGRCQSGPNVLTREADPGPATLYPRPGRGARLHAFEVDHQPLGIRQGEILVRDRLRSLQRDPRVIGRRPQTRGGQLQRLGPARCQHTAQQEDFQQSVQNDSR